MANKQVKNSTSENHFYFSIYNYVKLHNCLPKGLGSKQKINYYVSKLKIFGAITKLGYGTYEVNEDKFNELRSKNFKLSTSKVSTSSLSSKDKLKKRGHNFQFTLQIPKLLNWDKRESFLIKNRINYKICYNKGTYYSIGFQQNKIWLCNSSIVIYLGDKTSYISNSAKDSQALAYAEAYRVINHLENLFKVSFKIDSKHELDLVRQHYADIGNEIGVSASKRNEKIAIKDDAGTTWLLVDNSLGDIALAETETVDSKRAVSDMDKVLTPLMNKLRADPVILDKIDDRLNQISELLYAQAFIQKDFMQNVAIRISELEKR